MVNEFLYFNVVAVAVAVAVCKNITTIPILTNDSMLPLLSDSEDASRFREGSRLHNSFSAHLFINSKTSTSLYIIQYLHGLKLHSRT
jgi:hypothetical protein